MDEAELLLWRIERLQAAVDRLEGGNLTTFGKRMGWADGSYVGQMLRGTRPITEKLIRKIESELPGWFEADFRDWPDSKEHQLRIELLNRDVPEHVLQTFLDLIKQYPPKNRVASGGNNR